MPYDPELLARNIGEIQAKAMMDMWRPDQMTRANGAVTGPQQEPMLMGPWAQALFTGDPMTKQDLRNPISDEYGMQALRDINSLKANVAQETAAYNFSRQLQQAEAEAAREAKKKSPATVNAGP